VVRTSKAVMPVTLNLKNAMISNGLTATKYIIVPNVVDDLFFKSNLTSSKTNLKRIIHVSTFEDRSKNISGIIDAIKTIAHHRTDFKMVFIGDGIDFERMIQKVKLLELTDRIEFTCLLEKEALVNEFEKASFLLINSNYENMPVVINEAFACGLPVLSTDVGGISEHVSLERGRLIQPRQPKQLVEQIHWMLDHYMDFNSSEIRKYAEAHFSMDAVGKQLQQIYKTALNK
jgi:glycosyltransferase involved in cell wall biosynthesis